MSRRRRLLCSLPIVALTLVAAGVSAARGATELIDVKDADVQPVTLPLDDNGAEQSWTMVWTDLDVTDGDAPPAGNGESFVRVTVDPPKAPAVIAAPLPPALLPGLIGLAGVYVYKRRHRLR